MAVKSFEDILKKVETKLGPSLQKKHGIVCKQLAYSGSAPLYFAKPHWTNRFDDNRENTIGVFCAVWVSKSQLDKQKFLYNIHSKKLRELPGHKLESRKFADKFRAAVKTKASKWPGINFDYGPGTLLQGQCDCSLDSLEESVIERLNGFLSISDDIDKLLLAGKI